MATGSLASFLGGHRTAIVDLFVTRVPETFRAGLTRSELVDQLPEVIAEIASGIQAGRWPPAEIFEHSPTGSVYGRQRLRVRFDLDAVVREYGLVDAIADSRRSVEQVGQR